MLSIEILYFDGCPTHKGARELVRRIVRDQRITADIREINVTTEAEAKALKFPGSPTVRINGRDIDELTGNVEYGLKCRVYSGPQGFSGVPPVELMEKALREASGGRVSHCC